MVRPYCSVGALYFIQPKNNSIMKIATMSCCCCGQAVNPTMNLRVPPIRAAVCLVLTHGISKSCSKIL